MPAPESDLSLLADAARAAGAIALRHWKRGPETWEKSAGAGPVTEADLAIDEMLRSDLTAARPGYGWLSEETEDSAQRHAERRAAQAVFIVDPIDGTRAFIAGEPTFAHSLAVAEAGLITAAAVYLPVPDLLFTAAVKGPATLNGQGIRPAKVSDIHGASLLTAHATLHPEHWQGGHPPPVRREFRASLAYRLCLVAEGRFDAMMSLRPTWEWDVAAGSLIAARAGAKVTDRHGKALAFNADRPQSLGVLAAPPALHGQILRRLKP